MQTEPATCRQVADSVVSQKGHNRPHVAVMSGRHVLTCCRHVAMLAFWDNFADTTSVAFPTECVTAAALLHPKKVRKYSSVISSSCSQSFSMILSRPLGAMLSMKQLLKEIAAGTRRDKSFVVPDNPHFNFLVFLVMSVELVFFPPPKEVVLVGGGVSRLSASWDAFLVRMTLQAAGWRWFGSVDERRQA